jgi:hypothetical protein
MVGAMISGIPFDKYLESRFLVLRARPAPPNGGAATPAQAKPRGV